jgi:ferredoxin-NADP reductase/MOSC domain-containing protein YiiM
VPFVIAVSTSVPRMIEIRGRPTLTSIVREPHRGPLRFAAGGPEGNQTAVHTEEVLATNAESYDYWARELGATREQWTDCYWGENLLLSGLDEHTLRIGDRLEIGPEAIFEVTSPRNPCFKLAWRLGQPDSFLHDLVQSGRTGFYLRVVSPGDVGAGDQIVVRSPATAGMTVAELSRLLHEKAPDPDRLAAALTAPALGRQASMMICSRIAQLTEGERCRSGRWTGWRRFTVKQITPESSEVRSFRLAPADKGELAPFRAGQFLTVRLPGADGGPLTRAWSLSDYEEGGATYRLTVRRTVGGRGSVFLHDRVSVADSVEARCPTGAFALDRSTFLRVALISAGIGVTPLLAMLKAHACRPEPPPLLWIHSTQSGLSHVLREEVRAVLGAHSQFRSHINYTAPGPEDLPGVHYQEAGRLTPERLVQLLGSSYLLRPFGREIELPAQMGLFYVCGPPGFTAWVRGALIDFGVDPAAIHFEQFGRVSNAPPTVDRCEVRFKRSEKTATWHRERDISLLELAEETGVDAASNCRAGSCHTCQTGLIAGSVRYALEPLQPPQPGRVLICCARPASRALELDL